MIRSIIGVNISRQDFENLSSYKRAVYLINVMKVLVSCGIIFYIQYNVLYDAPNYTRSMGIGVLIGSMLIINQRQIIKHFYAYTTVAILDFFVVISLSCIFTGGAQSPSMWWWGIVPAVSWLILDIKSSIIWSIASILFPSLIFLADFYGISFPANELTGDDAVMAYISNSIALGIVINAFFYLYYQITKALEQENKDYEQSLVHSANLAMMGEIVASISHEINNPLEIISSNVNLMKLKAQKGELSNQQLIDKLIRTSEIVERVGGVVETLRMFAKTDKGVQRQIELCHVMNDILPLVRNKFFSQRISLEIDDSCENKNFVLIGNNIQLSQVFINIFNNAADAVKDLNEKWVRVSGVEINNMIEIRVIDSGKGIPKYIQENLFHSFFSSKSVGQGSGLGLTLCYNIIESHGGKIFIDNDCENTCFVIQLPLATACEDYIDQSA